MAVTPKWQAATTGSGGNAGFVNQFLGTHSSSFIYNSGALRSSQTTGTGIYSDTLTQWISQQITTATTQTTISQVGLQISTIGGSPTSQLINPLTVSLYADSGGFPIGPALVSTSVVSSVVYSSPFFVIVPLPITHLTGSTIYHLVVTEVGTTGHYYVWQRSNQVAGAHTSPDGVTWTSLSYGLMYQIYDQTGTTGSQVQNIYDDAGNRIISFTYNTNGTLATINEYTVAQSGSTLVQARTLNYTSGLVTGVS